MRIRYTSALSAAALREFVFLVFGQALLLFSWGLTYFAVRSRQGSPVMVVLVPSACDTCSGIASKDSIVNLSSVLAARSSPSNNDCTKGDSL